MWSSVRQRTLTGLAASTTTPLVLGETGKVPEVMDVVSPGTLNGGRLGGPGTPTGEPVQS